MAWVYSYFAIGIVVSFAMVFTKPREPVSPLLFAIAVLVIIWGWPVCLLGGYLQARARIRNNVRDH